MFYIENGIKDLPKEFCLAISSPCVPSYPRENNVQESAKCARLGGTVRILLSAFILMVYPCSRFFFMKINIYHHEKKYFLS